MCVEYNGYSNYQTWNVALWLDNEPGSNEMLHNLANGLSEFSLLTTDIQKADYLKEFMEDHLFGEVEGVPAGPLADLLNHSLGMVDYLEIIRTHKEE